MNENSAPKKRISPLLHAGILSLILISILFLLDKKSQTLDETTKNEVLESLKTSLPALYQTPLEDLPKLQGTIDQRLLDEQKENLLLAKKEFGEIPSFLVKLETTSVHGRFKNETRVEAAGTLTRMAKNQTPETYRVQWRCIILTTQQKGKKNTYQLKTVHYRDTP
jgi:hypothetical protein